ncbi:phosphatase PAP2 family protein [Streptomyces sp. NPDC096198]|uniref:phosphatase PAP2 family protein n=1 Tax=Streptomyces sp. NPDC096198 TaxID=3366080 RepID=UPI0037F45497
MRGVAAARPALWTAAGGVVALGLLTLTVTGRGGAPFSADVDLLRWATEHRPSAAVAMARAVTFTGTGVVPYALAVLAGLLAARTPRRRAPSVAAAVGCLAAGQALRYGLMTLEARPRPPRQDWLTQASGWSFPSGHATTSAITAGLLAVAVLVRVPRAGAALAAAVVGWGVLVGLTRVYLGVHWFSDVLGGWLFALSWLSLCGYAAARLAPGTRKAGAVRSPPSPPSPR